MANMNLMVMAGRLTRDPQLKFLPNGTALCEIGMAVEHKYKDKKEVCFIDCAAFGKPAETLNQYVKKGDPLLVEGRLKLDQWEAKDGSKRSKHSLIIESFQFLGGRRDAARPTDSMDSAPPPDDDMPF